MVGLDEGIALLLHSLRKPQICLTTLWQPMQLNDNSVCFNEALPTTLCGITNDVGCPTPIGNNNSHFGSPSIKREILARLRGCYHLILLPSSLLKIDLETYLNSPKPILQVIPLLLILRFSYKNFLDKFKYPR